MQPHDQTSDDAAADAAAAYRMVVNARLLWSGGAAAAVVTALIAVVGVVVVRGILDIAVLAPQRSGAFGDASTWGLAIGAAGATLLATALMQLLLSFTPRPFLFFGWIVGLLTFVAVLAPFATSAEFPAKLATAMINLLLGVAIGSLVGGTAARSVTGPFLH